MKYFSLSVLGIVAILFGGCTSFQPKPEETTVKSVKKEVVNNKLITVVIDEKADKSVIDSGGSSRLPAQRYISVGNFFGDYNLLKSGAVLLSKYNIDKNSNVRSSDIWLYGKGKSRLTNASCYNSYPAMSLDEQYVYFVSNRGKGATSNYDQTSYIWRMSSQGNGGLTRIGTAMNQYYRPLMSPDGEKLLYVAKEFGGQQSMIWYMGKNGELPTQLKSGKQASWLDDNTILFTAQDEASGLFAIWKMDIDGSNLTQIIADKRMHCIQPFASYDGKHIAFVKQDGSASDQRDIFIYHLDTGLIDQMTTNSSRDDLPKWSKNNDYIYFRSSRGLAWNIWRIKTEL